MDILIVTYWFGIIYELIFRAPIQNKLNKLEKVEKRSTKTEAILLTLLWVVMIVLPLIYSLTDWIAFANYLLPKWMGYIGILLMAITLLLFSKAHLDLKSNWSPTVELLHGHRLITSGIYNFIRHPMYASQWIWVIAQMLLIQNWIAGPVGLLFFIPFYSLRVKAEERMMTDKFGDEYRRYIEKTGSIIPKAK